ncbi:MAG: hypothetical protein M3O30_19090, partial [Planctomycetota bacterium]|nr:hypothetical protein [Planctomycetota bacterium]
MTTEATDQISEAPTPDGPIIAKAGAYYRRTRFVMVIVLALYGGWSLHDGFISWPHWTETHPDEKPKSEMDIRFNQVLGCALPPLGIILLIRMLYNSRGEYRLENGIVYIPGHPPVPLERIQTVHREKWDRKGIADVEYDQDGKSAMFRLDDFVYDRDPTDAIFTEIEQTLLRTAGRGDENEDRAAAPATVTVAPLVRTPAKPALSPTPAGAPKPVRPPGAPASARPAGAPPA